MTSFLQGGFYCSHPIPTPTLHIGGMWAEPDNLPVCSQVTKLWELSLLLLEKVVCDFMLDARTRWGSASTRIFAYPEAQTWMGTATDFVF